MGLDQYAGFRDSNGEVHEEFYWRKHARLQKFFSKHFEKIVSKIIYSHIQFLLQTGWSLNHSAGFKPFSFTISFKYLIPLFNHSLKNTGLLF